MKFNSFPAVFAAKQTKSEMERRGEKKTTRRICRSCDGEEHTRSEANGGKVSGTVYEGYNGRNKIKTRNEWNGTRQKKGVRNSVEAIARR